MSEIATIVSALPRIERFCRPDDVRTPGSGDPVTENQLRTLAQLDAVDPVMVTELADFLGVTASTMSLNLKRLEEAGLVRRSRDPADRRVTNVRLTDEGMRVREHFGTVDPGRVARLLDRLHPSERRRAAEAFARLAEAADTLREP
jgi:DNA-binding MarR family transcriptional regulator